MNNMARRDNYRTQFILRFSTSTPPVHLNLLFCVSKKEYCIKHLSAMNLHMMETFERVTAY